MSSRNSRVSLVFALLLGCIAPLAQAQQPVGTAAAERPTSFFFVQRTKGHVKYSKSDVFLSFVDDVSAYLDANHVALAKDEFGGRTHAEAEMPISTVLDIARDSHASYVLYLIVDRPLTKWIKVTVRSYDVSGKELWQEEVSSGGGLSGGHGLRVTLEKLHKQLDKKLGQDGLPTYRCGGEEAIRACAAVNFAGDREAPLRTATIMAMLCLECLFICAASPGQTTCRESTGTQSSKSTVILREMTDVPLKLAEDVNSRTAKQAQAVEFALAQDLKVGDTVVAKAGSRAIGTAVHSKTPDFWGEPGELNVRITFLKAGNTKVPLRGASGEVGTRYVVVRGSQAVMKRGMAVKAYVDTDTELQPLDSVSP